MRFLNREREMTRLDGLVARGGGFAAVHGRRRIGKTRLLVEWVKRNGGVYTVADQSSADVQRRYFAEAVSERIPAFGDVEYRDWRSLLARLAREAGTAGWKGPLVLDEFPYLVQQAPELPSVLQRWIDHEAGGLVVVVAGSSQHMMQGLVLASEAPLFGRAQQNLDIQPLDPRLLPAALGSGDAFEAVEAFTAWGGVPRYWELAAEVGGSVERTVDSLVLDPMGPLHREPDRLIAEELPPATEVRALLDAIGGGAHRISEIAGRIGRPSTSLSRPIQRLQGMGLVRREVPFGEAVRSSKRSLYRIADPFTRLWFRTVAPNRARLATATPDGRRVLFGAHWPRLLGEGWEDLCRLLVPTLGEETALGVLGPWEAPSRWWKGNNPEWDLVARSLDGRRILIGEAKVGVSSIERAWRDLEDRAVPALSTDMRGIEVVRALFVADAKGSPLATGPALVVTASDLLGC